VSACSGIPVIVAGINHSGFAGGRETAEKSGLRTRNDDLLSLIVIDSPMSAIIIKPIAISRENLCRWRLKGKGRTSMAATTGHRLDEIAQDLFEVLTQIALATQAGLRRGMDLKEVEFLTLAILHAHDTMIVGDIQRLLGVLPAQMSRIIRSLEGRQSPLIVCQINPRDKRKIDVRLTSAGTRALLEYQDIRVRKLTELLQSLPEEEHDDLSRLIQKLSELFDRGRGVDGMLRV
jgi:DNA-binding MarR family transcriptional regulator